jgi:DNA-binding NarL/FixJ family response regulator
MAVHLPLREQEKPRYREGSMRTLRLLVADDHEIVRKGLCALLGAQPGWEIAAEARDGREAVKMAKECKPDVAVLDISMPGLNGLEAARQINKTVSHTKVLVLTMHESDKFIGEALEAGVRGFLLKSDAGKDLVGAVEALGRNQTFFTSEVAQVILDGHLKPGAATSSSSSAEDSGPRFRLTGRQREIVQLLAEGKSSKEVATVLDVSVKTVETHRANIMGRLNCHCVTDLVRYAIRNHIVEP